MSMIKKVGLRKNQCRSQVGDFKMFEYADIGTEAKRLSGNGQKESNKKIKEMFLSYLHKKDFCPVWMSR